MITVWCMNTNNHAPDEEVRILKRQVDRHLTEPHIFQCISEHHIDGIHNVQPINDIPGWWGKSNLFAPTVSHTRNLWLDLDVTITGDIDCLVTPLEAQLRIAKNWAMSGHGGCQSSVMYWEGASAQIIHDEFDPAIAFWPPRNEPGVCLWGDQEWITVLRDDGRLQVEYFDHKHVVSYKYHCRQGLPLDSLVQVFHGKPSPADVNDQWVKDARA